MDEKEGAFVYDPARPQTQQQCGEASLLRSAARGARWTSHVPIAPKNAAPPPPPPPQLSQLSQYPSTPPPAYPPGHISRSGALLTKRLPPRSRNGCWTCRTRKVKCDEQRPRCGQCFRLQHGCDYRPRLSFRDDTARVIERVPDVITTGSVWDPNGPSFRGDASSYRVQLPRDIPQLPPFATLINDEDRELKAIRKRPGTYNLVCTPDSFVSAGSDDGGWASAVCSTFVPSSPTLVIEPIESGEGQKESLQLSELNIFGEEAGPKSPNVVIVHHFEDPVRRRSSLSASVYRTRRDPMSPSCDLASSELSSNIERPPTYIACQSGGANATRYWEHWRAVIAPRLMLINCDIPANGSGLHASQMVNRFEQEIGESYQHCPLFHAIMALTALSHNYQTGGIGEGSVRGLQYYQTAISNLGTSLRSDSDLRSDKALLSHLVLLIFEVAAAREQRQELWQHHLNQLLSLVSARTRIQGVEPYPFLIWYIAVVDTYAALSAEGDGNFVITAQVNGLLPEPEDIMPSPPIESGPEEIAQFKSIFTACVKANRKVHYLAAAVARLSRRLGMSPSTFAAPGEGKLAPGDADSEIGEMVVDLKGFWESECPEFMKYGAGSCPEMTASVVSNYGEQATALYHACIIYCHTSMYPSQAISLDPSQMQDIDAAVEAILGIARDIIRSGRCAQGSFVIFPLFLAGYAAKSTNLKKCVIQSLSVLGDFFVGQNIAIFKQMLLEIHQEQGRMDAESSSGLAVNWKKYLDERNCRIINFVF